MSVLSAQYPTMLDIASRLDPDGKKVATIIEMLSAMNPILQDMVVQECNNKTVHKSTIRTGLPGATWRKMYGGVQPDKSETAQIQDSCGMLEAYSQIDKAQADLAPDKSGFLASESVSFLEGMSQEMANTLFYGDQEVTPERFTGLSPRYNSYGNSKRKSSYNVINAGGTGSTNTSLWFCTWSPLTMFGLYPAGGKAGFSHEDLGRQTVTKSDGSMYEVYRSHYLWYLGLCVRDWRYNVRVANIDVNALESGSAADLLQLMIKAYHRMPSLNTGKHVIYCNRTVATALDIQARQAKNVILNYSEVDGHPQTSFRGIPIRVCDALLDTEAAVPAAV